MALSPRRALMWSFAERYASFVITVASTLVLARLLTPAQVGVYSLCASLGTVAAILRDFGVSEYLIQERELTRAKVRAAFAVAIAVAWSLGLAIYLAREPAARFFAEPGVAQVLAVTALHFLILPISSPAFALLNREMAFQKIFGLQIVCNAAQAATSIGLAWRGHGTLSLAWGPIANVGVQTLILAWLLPRGTFLMPGMAGVRGVLRFGLAYMSSRMIETLAQNFHESVIAKVYGFAAVGLFSRAVGMVELFRTHVGDAIVRVATPAFAAEHRAGRDVGEALLRATAIFTCVAWPFFAFVALCAHELVYVLFGSQWLAAAPLAAILAIAAFPAAIYELVPQMLSATGHVGRRLKVSVWVSPLHVAAVLLASTTSLQAVAAVWILSSTAMLALCVVQLRAVLGIGAGMLFRHCRGSLAIAVASALAQGIAVMGLRALAAPAVLTLLGTLAAGALTWVAAARASDHPALEEALRVWGAARGRLKRAFEWAQHRA